MGYVIPVTVTTCYVFGISCVTAYCCYTKNADEL